MSLTWVTASGSSRPLRPTDLGGRGQRVPHHSLPRPRRTSQNSSNAVPFLRLSGDSSSHCDLSLLRAAVLSSAPPPPDSSSICTAGPHGQTSALACASPPVSGAFPGLVKNSSLGPCSPPEDPPRDLGSMGVTPGSQDCPQGSRVAAEGSALSRPGVNSLSVLSPCPAQGWSLSPEPGEVQTVPMQRAADVRG